MHFSDLVHRLSEEVSIPLLPQGFIFPIQAAFLSQHGSHTGKMTPQGVGEW